MRTLTEGRYIYDRMRDIEFAKTNGIDKIMDEYRLDALMFLESTSLAAISGHPAIIIPAGIDNGTPYGLQFIGRQYGESVIIKLGYVYEQATKYRIAPPLMIYDVEIYGAATSFHVDWRAVLIGGNNGTYQKNNFGP